MIGIIGKFQPFHFSNDGLYNHNWIYFQSEFGNECKIETLEWKRQELLRRMNHIFNAIARLLEVAWDMASIENNALKNYLWMKILGTRISQHRTLNSSQFDVKCHLHAALMRSHLCAFKKMYNVVHLHQCVLYIQISW